MRFKEKYQKEIEAAIKIMQEVHEGFKRKNSDKPYAVHPLAVEYNVTLLPEYWTLNSIERHRARLAAIFHDITEGGEGDKYKNEELKLVMDFEKESGIMHQNYEDLVHALAILNRNYYENYYEYIWAVSLNSVTRIVKMADLQHNMLDLEEGSRKDKYRLAFHLLSNTK